MWGHCQGSLRIRICWVCLEPVAENQKQTIDVDPNAVTGDKEPRLILEHLNNPNVQQTLEITKINPKTAPGHGLRLNAIMRLQLNLTLKTPIAILKDQNQTWY